MEPLAFVEVVDRHLDVLSRHPVHRWPVKIGRGYDADVIVDDPYVAPTHLTIEPADDGRYAVASPGTLNGLAVRPSEKRVETATIGADDLVRIGHTHLRIRPPGYAVVAERPMRAIAVYRRPLGFAALAGLALAVLLWNAWIVASGEDESKYAFIAPVLGFAAAMVAWISLWSFVSSAVRRGANFAAHGSVASAGVVAVIACIAAFEYVAFAFDLDWLEHVETVAVAALIAYILYRHLLLNSRARRRSLMLVGATASIVLFGGVAAYGYLVDPDEGDQVYGSIVKPTPVLLVGGVPLDAFMNEARPLKAKVDALGRKTE